jgi:hypothetical protein
MEMWRFVVACLLVGITTGYIAKIKCRSPWVWPLIWGALGLIVFGPVVHTVVGILIAFLFFS